MSFRWWILVSVSLFVIGFLSGINGYNNSPADFNNQTVDLQRLSESLLSLPQPVLMIAIFIKNIIAVAFSIALSPLLLVVPIVTLLLNGWIVGFLAMPVVQEQSVGYLLAALLPHGIFELPALFLGEAVAFSIGSAAIIALLKNQTAGLKNSVKREMRFLVPIVILFAVAAVIETYVTPAALSLAI